MSSAMKIHREQIIDTAMTLLDRDGLEGVTVRKVAAELNVHPGALYWHVRNKQELLEEMANALLAEQFTPLEGPAPEQDWADWLRDICTRLRLALLAHREGARVVAGASYHRAVLLSHLVMTIIGSLQAAGFSLHLAYITCITALSYVYGFVIEEQAAPSTETINKVRERRTDSAEGTLLETLIREHQGRVYTEADFLEGLEMLLDGMKRKFAKQTSSP